MRWFLISLMALLLLACATPTGGDGLDPGQAYLTITNGLEWRNIIEIDWRRSIEWESGWDEWSWDGQLEPGDSVWFIVGTNTYDIRCTTETATFTRYDVDITEDGYTWEVTPEDRDD